MNTRAFTLIEILLVLAVMGILMAVMITNFANASRNARASDAGQQGAAISAAISGFLGRNLDFTPSTLITAGFRAGSMANAPAKATAYVGGDTIYDCASGYTLSALGVSTTPSASAGWLATTSGVGCVLLNRSSGGLSSILVVTYFRGVNRVFVNGREQP